MRPQPQEISVDEQAQAIIKQIQRQQAATFNEATSSAIQQAITQVLMEKHKQPSQQNSRDLSNSFDG